MPVRRAVRASHTAPPGLLVTALAVAVLFAGPTAYLVVENLRLDDSVVSLVTSADTLVPLGRSLLLAVTVSASSALVGTTLAWLTTRSDVPLRRVWRLLAPLPLVIPSFVGAAALVAGLAPGGLLEELLGPFGVQRMPTVDGFWGAWLVLSLFTYPYVYLPVAARFASLPPSFEESARLLGRRPVAVFRTVVLPQSSTAIWAGTLLVFLYTVSDFGAVAIMRYGTLTREIFANKLVPERWLPLGLVLAVVALVVVALERAAGRRRARTESVRARQALHVPLGRWRWPALGFCAVALGNALLGPLAVLGWWAVRGLLHPDQRIGALATDPGSLVVPATNTALVSVAAAVLTVALVLPAAYLTSRYSSRAGGAANAMVVGGFALPGLVVALSLVAWVLAQSALEPLYQTIALLLVAYAVHFGAQAMRAAQVSVSTVPRRFDEAARMLGAGRLRRLRTIDLPLMRPGLLAGGGLVLLSVMKELPATLLLAPPGFVTLATEIWTANESYELAQVGLASLVLVALSGALTWVLVIRRSERLD
ncbi:MAG: iron ABC transporter permease [Acidimicrobiales bacterium]|jgi:iron(III) transport system permease protein|nr:iron ABC transporter permease [Acidimicrobiales bacterium]